MSRSWPWPTPPLVYALARRIARPAADRSAAHGATRPGPARTTTGRWSRETPASPGLRDTPKPTTPRSARVTRSPRACVPPPAATAGTAPASLGGDATPAAARPDPPATPDTRPARHSRSPRDTPSTGSAPSPAAIARNDNPAARPREISSRSANDKRSSLRSRGVGRLPPASAMNFRSDTFCLPRCFAMRFTGTPASRMSQITAFSASENRLTPAPPDRRRECSPIRQPLR